MRASACRLTFARAVVSSSSSLSSLVSDHVGRGKLVSKQLKFPLSADHAVCIGELDRKQWYLLLNMCTDLKNNYTLVYDMVTKNMDKVVRQNDLDNYQSMY